MFVWFEVWKGHLPLLREFVNSLHDRGVLEMLIFNGFLSVWGGKKSVLTVDGLVFLIDFDGRKKIRLRFQKEEFEHNNN